MMQQTETYKLNKPESTDTFSVGPLNENADKIETALAALDGTAADHETRITALELKKVVVGTYEGNASASDPNTKQTIELGFAPAAVLVVRTWNTSVDMASPGTPSKFLTLTETGFQVRNGNYEGLNLTTVYYCYAAFG